MPENRKYSGRSSFVRGTPDSTREDGASGSKHPTSPINTVSSRAESGSSILCCCGMKLIAVIAATVTAAAIFPANVRLPPAGISAPTANKRKTAVVPSDITPALKKLITLKNCASGSRDNSPSPKNPAKITMPLRLRFRVRIPPSIKLRADTGKLMRTSISSALKISVALTPEST